MTGLRVISGKNIVKILAEVCRVKTEFEKKVIEEEPERYVALPQSLTLPLSDPTPMDPPFHRYNLPIKMID